MLGSPVRERRTEQARGDRREDRLRQKQQPVMLYGCHPCVDFLAARLAGQQSDQASGALAPQLGNKRLGGSVGQDPIDHASVEAVELQGCFELALGASPTASTG